MTEEEDRKSGVPAKGQERTTRQTLSREIAIAGTGEVGERIEEDGRPTQTFEEVIRGMIRHENELLNSRMSWLLTLEGFLFAALGFAWEKDHTRCLALLLSLVGMLVALSAGVMLHCSNRAVARLHDEWCERRKKEANYAGPGVVGFWAGNLFLRLFQPARVYPPLLAAAWLIILFVHIGHWIWDVRSGETAERFVLFLAGDKTGYAVVADPETIRSLQEGRALVIQSPNSSVSTVPIITTAGDPRLPYPLTSDKGEPATTAIQGSP
jgi:hypothetical protein